MGDEDDKRERLNYVVDRICELAAISPEFRRDFDEVMFEFQTNHPPNGETYANLQFLRDGLAKVK